MKNTKEPIFRIPPVLMGRHWAVQEDFEHQWWAQKYTKYHKDGVTGEGVCVVVVDTGVDPNHPDLVGRVAASFDGFGSDPAPAPEHPHGTMVSSVIAAGENGVGVLGLAPKSTIVSARGLNRNGSGTSQSISRAIELGCSYAVDNFKHVILNMSFGSDQESSMIQGAIDKWASRGVLPVAASGNGGGDGQDYPSANPRVIALGAVDSNNRLARFSDWGDVDATAPGVNMRLATLRGGWQEASGTSFSTPHFCGAMALHMSAFPDFWGASTPRFALAINLLKTSCIDLGDAGKDQRYGYGIIDPDKLLSAAAPPPPPNPQPATGELKIRNADGTVREFSVHEKSASN